MDQTASTTTARASADDGYDTFLEMVRRRFARYALAVEHTLYQTSARAELWKAYLDAAPPEERQHRNCRSCQQFIERFGALVSIDDDGAQHSVMWDSRTAPLAYFEAALAMQRAVERATVEGVFLSTENVWGTPYTGDVEAPRWTHFAVVPPALNLHRNPIFDAGQVMAEKRQDYEMLGRSLHDFPLAAVREAHALLTTEKLFRSEKCIGVASWLLNLHERLATAKHAKRNLLWRAVALAPPGFVHVRSGMIGTLLEDVVAQVPFATLKRKFDEKMNPLQYQRPTAAPSDGQIEQAEKITSKLRSAGALERRFARISDTRPLWIPSPPKVTPPSGGVFGHLKSKSPLDALIDLKAPATVMTWSKFERTVLSAAEKIECLVPPGRANFCAYTTATNADAPPILQWDREELRNPVSWYVYVNGSPASQWSITPGWCEVSAVILQPTMWDPERAYAHQSESVLFALKGARDARNGVGFFVEQLRAEYHGIRKTLEAYARAMQLTGREDENLASGLRFQKGSETAIDERIVRVTARGVVTTFKLDRWD